jgi:hypothetical protein
MRRFALAALFFVGVTGCFERPRPECAFLCGNDPNARCPQDYVCRDDGICKRGDLADDFSCPDIDLGDAGSARRK